MPFTIVAFVEETDVWAENIAHHVAERLIERLRRQMEVVPHEAVVEAPHSRVATRLDDQREEPPPILVIDEYGPAVHAP
jgi:hypothetical protein